MSRIWLKPLADMGASGEVHGVDLCTLVKSTSGSTGTKSMCGCEKGAGKTWSFGAKIGLLVFPFG